MNFPSTSRSVGASNSGRVTPSTPSPEDISQLLAESRYGGNNTNESPYADNVVAPLSHFNPHVSTPSSRFGSIPPYDDLFSTHSGSKRPRSGTDSLDGGIDDEATARVVKKRRVDYAVDLVSRLGIEGSNAAHLKQLAEGDVMMVLLECVGQQMVEEQARKKEVAKHAMERTAFKEKVGLRIKTALCYPSLAMYKKKLPERVFDLCIKDPTAWDLPTDFQNDTEISQLVKEKISAALHTGRNQLKTNIGKSIKACQSITGLVKACVAKGASPTQAMLGRMSFLRYAYVEFSKALKDNPEGFKVKLGDKDVVYKKDCFWDYVDDSLIKLRTRLEDESDEERTKRIDECLQEILKGDHDLYPKSSRRVGEWFPSNRLQALKIERKKQSALNQTLSEDKKNE